MGLAAGLVSTLKFTEPMLLMLPRSDEVSTDTVNGRDPFVGAAAAGAGDGADGDASWADV